MDDPEQPQAGPSRIPYEEMQSSVDMDGEADADAEGEEEEQVLYYVDGDGNRLEPEMMEGYAVLDTQQPVEGEMNMQVDQEEQLERLGMQVEYLDEEQAGGTTAGLEEAATIEAMQEEQQETVQEEQAVPPNNRYARPFYPKKWHKQQEEQRKHANPRTGSFTNGHSNGGTPSSNEKADLPDYALRYQLRGHRKHVSSVKISPDGKWLATAGADGRILLFSLPPSSSSSSPPVFIRAFSVPPPPQKLIRPGAPAYAAGGPIGSEGINEICFSLDSKGLASAGDDKLVRIWQLPTIAGIPEEGDENGSSSSSSTPAHSASSTAINPVNGQLINSQTPPSSTRVLKGHTSFVFCISYSPSGNLLASGSFDETIRIWDVKKGRCLRTLPAHSDPVSGLAFSRDGTLLLSCGHDGLLRLWDTLTGQCLKSLVDEANPPASSACFTPNSRYILASSLDSTIRLWDYHASECVKVYTGHKNIKYHIPSLIHLPPKGAGESEHGVTQSRSQKPYVISGSEDGKIYFWDLQSREVVLQLGGHKDPVLCLALHPSSGMLVTASLDREHTVKIWIDRRAASTPATVSNGTGSPPATNGEADAAEKAAPASATTIVSPSSDRQIFLPPSLADPL